MKKTLVIGASEKTDRYSNMAIHRLLEHRHPVLAIGSREGQVNSVKIEVGMPTYAGIHTVTMYVNPERQKAYYDYVLSLQPKRIIFNPGTENPEFESMAEAKGIETVEGCTLVMLGSNQF